MASLLEKPTKKKTSSIYVKSRGGERSTAGREEKTSWGRCKIMAF